jgi:hypothetical protein
LTDKTNFYIIFYSEYEKYDDEEEYIDILSSERGSMAGRSLIMVYRSSFGVLGSNLSSVQRIATVRLHGILLKE